MLCSYIVDEFHLTRLLMIILLLLTKQNYYTVLSCLTLCFKIQLWQLSYPFSRYSSSLCVIHTWVLHTIIPCLNASMFSCHQQFLFLQSILCFLDTNIAFEFEYCC